MLVSSGCSFSAAANAPSQVREFTFTAPGGQTRIFYDPPVTRGRVSGLGGDDLMVPGRRIGIDDFRDQVVVLNIWGAWCGPCRTEMPELQKAYEMTRASGVTMLGIDVRDDRDAARDFLRDRAITFPSIFDPPGRALLALDGFPRNTVPSTVVLDRRHRVAAVYLTAIRVSELVPVITRLAEEPPTGPAAGSTVVTAPTTGAG